LKAVRIHAEVLKAIRVRPGEERTAIGRQIAEAQRCLGHPHLHRGVGLRKLKDDWYEIRVGLKLRVVFENTPNVLVFECLGTTTT